MEGDKNEQKKLLDSPVKLFGSQSRENSKLPKNVNSKKGTTPKGHKDIVENQTLLKFSPLIVRSNLSAWSKPTPLVLAVIRN